MIRLSHISKFAIFPFINPWYKSGYDKLNAEFQKDQIQKNLKKNGAIRLFLNKIFKTIDYRIAQILFISNYFASIFFKILVLPFAFIFYLFRYQKFLKNISMRKDLFLEYLGAFGKEPYGGTSLMKALEGYYFNQTDIQAPSLEIGSSLGYISKLHFKGKKITWGSEFYLGHIGNQLEEYDLWENFIACDVRKIPFEDNSLQDVVAVHVMDHVWELEQSLDEIHRVLKPQGRFVFSLFSDQMVLNSTLSVILRAVGLQSIARKYGLFLEETHRKRHHFYLLEQWKHLLEKKFDIEVSVYFLNNFKWLWYFNQFIFERRMPTSYRQLKKVFGIPLYNKMIKLMKLLDFLLFCPLYNGELNQPKGKGLDYFFVLKKRV